MATAPISEQDWQHLGPEGRIEFAHAKAAGRPFILPWKRTRETNAAAQARRFEASRGERPARR